MKLRNRLSLNYTTAFIVLLSITLTAIFFSVRTNRKNEFHQHFSEKTLSAFQLFIEMQNLDDSILRRLDKHIVNNLRNNTLLFDSSGRLIYSSTGIGKPQNADEILKRLQHQENDIFVPDSTGEVLGISFTAKGNTYYGIARADDIIGKSMIKFLALLLLGSFFCSVVAIVLLSFYLSGNITRPITSLTKEIEHISPDKLSFRVGEETGTDEVTFLAGKFNEMLGKVESAFKFQRQFINHLSHELKTPLAIMTANAETAFLEHNIESYETSLKFQHSALAELSNIIDTMLEISRKENEFAPIFTDYIRVDELLFDCIDEVSMINDNAMFAFNMDKCIEQSDLLMVKGNSRMLKIAFSNLLRNAINYSSDCSAKLEISSDANFVQVAIINDGLTISAEDMRYLFKQLFRGTNGANKKGFGLGLLLTQKIISLHKGAIQYKITEDGKNCFYAQLQLC